MKLKVRGVPEGQYTGEFVSVEEREPTPDQQYGPGLCWAWLVVGGAFDGEAVTRITGDNPSAKSACGKFFRAITGQEPKFGTEVDFEPYIGKRFHLLVEAAPSGNGTRVASCVAIPEEK